MADFVIVLVIVLVAGLILGKIGSHFGAAHGREKEGFWLGFAFGPLGVLMASQLPENGKCCPKCRKIIHPKATICPYCRSENLDEASGNANRKRSAPRPIVVKNEATPAIVVSKRPPVRLVKTKQPVAEEAYSPSNDIPCPQCGAPLPIPATLEAKIRIRCAQCGNSFKVKPDDEEDE